VGLNDYYVNTTLILRWNIKSIRNVNMSMKNKVLSAISITIKGISSFNPPRLVRANSAFQKN
jgi:hypothetical protein